MWAKEVQGAATADAGSRGAALQTRTKSGERRVIAILGGKVGPHHLMVQLSRGVEADGLMDDRMMSHPHPTDRVLTTRPRFHLKSW